MSDESAVSTTQGVEEGSARAARSIGSLRSTLGRARTRGRAIPVERALMIAGAVLVGLGVPLMLLGWVGASHTPYVFEQVPYLISGGLLGLALTVLGGFFYFAYWMTRQVQETRRQTEVVEEALRRIEALVAGGAGRDGAVGQGQTNGSFLATARGTMFHRPDCAVVAERDDVRSVSSRDGLAPCKICNPAVN